jgi:hypothetical protein
MNQRSIEKLERAPQASDADLTFLMPIFCWRAHRLEKATTVFAAGSRRKITSAGVEKAF